MKKKMKRSCLLDAANSMPPLQHWDRTEPFDITHSEVCRWLTQQPELAQYLFNQVKCVNIVYDKESRTWRGVDWRP